MNVLYTVPAIRYALINMGESGPMLTKQDLINRLRERIDDAKNTQKLKSIMSNMLRELENAH